MATFTERFNSLFISSGKSQKEFGELFDASTDQVYNWRSGRGEPDSETMKRIADSCGVTVSYLVGESNERRPGAGILPIDDPEVLEFMKTVTGQFRMAPNLSDKERQEILEDLADYFKFQLQKRKEKQ